VTEYRPATPDQAEFLAELLGAGFLIESGVSGIYGRGEDFERIRCGFDARVSAAAAAEGPEQLTFPPLLPREQLERIRYLTSFPHLAGSVFAFEGDEEQASEQEQRAARHEDWSEYQRMTDLVLAPAACHPVYPAIAARGKLAPGGVTVDTGGDAYVFRHEPSGDPTRLQMFHMRELVRVAEPDAVAEWRERWRDRSVELLRSVGLDAGLDVASDPFFGQSGQFLADRQRAQELKFEVLVQVAGPEPTAVASSNYHQDHFASIYGIEVDAPDPTAHTACVAFGLERITLALLREHGLDLDAWPAAVRAELGL
jgi:seryl-tRNA synthetase